MITIFVHKICREKKTQIIWECICFIPLITACFAVWFLMIRLCNGKQIFLTIYNFKYVFLMHVTFGVDTQAKPTEIVSDQSDRSNEI